MQICTQQCLQQNSTLSWLLCFMWHVLTFPNVPNRRDTPAEYTFRLQLVYLAHRIVMHI